MLANELTVRRLAGSPRSDRLDRPLCTADLIDAEVAAFEEQQRAARLAKLKAKREAAAAALAAHRAGYAKARETRIAATAAAKAAAAAAGKAWSPPTYPNPIPDAVKGPFRAHAASPTASTAADRPLLPSPPSPEQREAATFTVRVADDANHCRNTCGALRPPVLPSGPFDAAHIATLPGLERVRIVGVDPGHRTPASWCDDQGFRGGMSKGEWRSLCCIDSARQQGEAWAQRALLRPTDPASPTVQAAVSGLAAVSLRTTHLRPVLVGIAARLRIMHGLLAHYGSRARRQRRLTVPAQRNAPPRTRPLPRPDACMHDR